MALLNMQIEFSMAIKAKEREILGKQKEAPITATTHNILYQ